MPELEEAVTVPLLPDSRRYLAMAAGERLQSPFHLRWLLPAVCKTPEAWMVVTRIAVVSLALSAWAYTGSPWAMAGVFLPGVWLNWRFPVLVDASGMALALAAAVAWQQDLWVVAILLVLLGATVRETTPVWAAVFAWHPVLLVGLIPVGLRMLVKEGTDLEELGPESQWILDFPMKASWKHHAGMGFDPLVWVAPWGPMVLALVALDVQLAVALAVGYGQCLVATDSVRLYQWAWPVVALAVVAVVPAAWLPLVAVGVVFNPWRGNGV